MSKRVDELRRRHLRATREVRELREELIRDRASPEIIFDAALEHRKRAAETPDRYTAPLTAAELDELYDALPNDPREPGEPSQERARGGLLSWVWGFLRGQG